MESRLKGAETAQGLSQHQGLIAFDLPVRLPLRAISSLARLLKDYPQKEDSCRLSQKGDMGFCQLNTHKYHMILGLPRPWEGAGFLLTRYLSSHLHLREEDDLYTLLCRFWRIHGLCVLSNLECMPALVVDLAQGRELGMRGDQRQGVCAYPPSAQDSYSHP